MSYDAKLNSQAIRLADLDRALVWVRQNAAGLGLGYNLVNESMRAERDEIINAMRRAGEVLSEEAIERSTAARAQRHQAAAA